MARRIRIRTYADPLEAAAARDRLDEAGIDGVLSTDALFEGMPGAALGTRSVELFVAEPDAEQAVAVLSQGGATQERPTHRPRLNAWFQWLLRGCRAPSLPFEPGDISLGGWELTHRERSAAYWSDASGDVISLTLTDVLRSLPTFTQPLELQQFCRRIAESQGAGLIDVEAGDSVMGPIIWYVYKRLEIPAFRFFGMLTTPCEHGQWTWMVVAEEHGTTGVREAAVTARLFESGALTLESFESSWAQDPYDPSYRGVDRSTLRYLSDSREYDADFPDHPLSKVRRELERLREVVLPPG